MNKAETMQRQLAKYPQVKADFAELKKVWPGVRLVWIKFADGTEIGKK